MNRPIETDPIATADRTTVTATDAPRPLSDIARQALAEAAARRAAQDARAAELARKAEIDGRGGLDPVRYGDWEVKGLTSDF